MFVLPFFYGGLWFSRAADTGGGCLRSQIATLKRGQNIKYFSQFRVVFEAINALMEEREQPKRKIGFIAKEHRAGYAAKRKKQSCELV